MSKPCCSARHVRLRASDPAKRRCLCGCGKLFWSGSAAERIRPECRRAQETRDAQYGRAAVPNRAAN